MKSFEILFLSATLLFSLSLKAEAVSCPATANVQRALQCSGNQCHATNVEGWSGNVQGIAHDAHGVTEKPTLTSEALLMHISRGYEKEQPACAYHTNQMNTTLILTPTP